MTRLATCGFEIQAGGEMTAQNHAFNTTITRTPGGVSFQGTSAGHYCRQDFTTLKNEIFIRFGVYTLGTVDTTHLYLRDLTDANIIVFNWQRNQPIKSQTWRGAWNVLGLTTVNMPDAGWQLVEIHVKIHPTNGVIEIKQDGVLTFVWRGSTTPQGRGLQRVLWYINSNGADYLDDIAINDTEGETDNSWCGDGYVVRLAPSGNGTKSELYGSDGNKVDNYVHVDERPGSTSDYVYGLTGQAMEDFYAQPSVSVGSNTIRRAWFAGSGWNNDYANQTMPKIGFEQDSQTFYEQLPRSINANVLTVFSQHLVNPITELPWTQTDLDELQLAVKVE